MDVLFQTLVEHSADAVVLLTADGTIRFASESVARVLGYEPAERVGKSGFEKMHPDDATRARRLLADVLAQPGTPLQAEYRVAHKDGSWRHIEAVAVNRLNDPQVGAIVINYRDITARRRAEDALRASEERLRHLVEHAQDLIYYCSLEGRFTYVNPAAARVMQYDEAELIGRHFMSLIHRDYRDAAGALYARQLLDRTPTTYFEFPALTRKGDTVWIGQHVQLVYDGDEVVAIHAIARDISRQKIAEEQLRRSEVRYRSLIQGAAYGIYRARIDGTILDANPAIAEMLGYDSVDDLMTRNMTDVYANPSERKALIDHYRAHARETMSTDVQWRRKNQSTIMVRLTARGVAGDDGGEMSAFEGIVEDVTERRVLEEQLRQSQKMEAVGRLARGVAHDFNNVLAAIMGSADLLVARLPESDPSREEADAIMNAAARGAALTRQLLTFSRRQALEPQILDLHAVVRGVEDMLLRLTGDVTVRLHTPGASPSVRVEPGQIEQVLLNLVVNARDALGEGGTIDLTADAIDLDEQGVLDYQGIPPGSYARLTVRDTGSGFSPEAQRHAFEPFFTTKGPSKGTGLGLSIVYGIAKEAGGTVTFSTSRNGTTFEVLLPKINPQAAG
jgi:two-component system, cell cycle sensor histidine kinase and response regulator CckA